MLRLQIGHLAPSFSLGGQSPTFLKPIFLVPHCLRPGALGIVGSSGRGRGMLSYIWPLAGCRHLPESSSSLPVFPRVKVMAGPTERARCGLSRSCCCLGPGTGSRAGTAERPGRCGGPTAALSCWRKGGDRWPWQGSCPGESVPSGLNYGGWGLDDLGGPHGSVTA